MRTEDEIQRAHDQLVGILLGETKFAKVEKRILRDTHVAASVLCWVLEHDHNPLFAAFLADLQKVTTEAGYTLERYENPSP